MNACGDFTNSKSARERWSDYMRCKSTEIPIWEKYTLSIEEAAAYFRIGEQRLRQIVSDNPGADFVLMNGNRIQIKRKLFEEYIDFTTAV